MKVKWSYRVDTKTVPGKVIVRLFGEALRLNGKPYDWKDAGPKAGSKGPIICEHEVQEDFRKDPSKVNKEALAKEVIARWKMKGAVERKIEKTLLAIGLAEPIKGSFRMEEPESINL